jgi:glycosyltransferase involved in cell wall biosynthesis
MDQHLINVSPSLFKNKYGLTDFVICVGRIEPLKNQVNLMKALKDDKDITVVFVGEIQNTHRNYVKEFLHLVSRYKHFIWLGTFDRSMLFSAMKNVHVVAMPSWFETCGLPGLEGGIFDANVVVTKRGYARWYYKQNAWYCDPADLSSIKASVFEAMNSSKGSRSFSDRIKKEYTWENYATQMLKAYQLALNA